MTDPDHAAFFGSQNGAGLTKREYFAALAMQGMLAHPSPERGDAFGVLAVALADDLIAALNERRE